MDVAGSHGLFGVFENGADRVGAFPLARYGHTPGRLLLGWRLRSYASRGDRVYRRQAVGGSGRLDSGGLQLRVCECLGARPGFSCEQHHVRESVGGDESALNREQAGFGDADDLVFGERFELDSLSRVGGADDGELDAACEQSVEKAAEQSRGGGASS